MLNCYTLGGLTQPAQLQKIAFCMLEILTCDYFIVRQPVQKCSLVRTSSACTHNRDRTWIPCWGGGGGGGLIFETENSFEQEPKPQSNVKVSGGHASLKFLKKKMVQFGAFWSIHWPFLNILFLGELFFILSPLKHKL